MRRSSFASTLRRSFGYCSTTSRQCLIASRPPFGHGSSMLWRRLGYCAVAFGTVKREPEGSSLLSSAYASIVDAFTPVPLATFTKGQGDTCEGEVEMPDWCKHGEGTIVVPHKVIVMDPEKAMRDNPALEKSDFCTLAELPHLNDKDLKIILVVGATGSGKSTAINSLMNYLYGVKFNDNVRLKLIQEPPTEERDASSATSLTDQVLGYLLEKPPAMNGKSLLIIDTPGFGDTRGPARDDETIAEVREFFKTHVLYLNAICFVVQASDTRACPLRKHVYNQVLSLFGKDVSDIIAMLFTFADASKPPAIATIKSQDITYSKLFKLNNSAFYTLHDDESVEAEGDVDAAFVEMFWNLGMVSFEKLITYVVKSQDVSLEQTKRVLHRRNELQLFIEQIRKEVDKGLSKLNRLESTLWQVRRCKSLIDANNKFTMEVDDWKDEKKMIPAKSGYNTVCDSCSFTCHASCVFDDSKKMRCAAINRDSGNCKYCPDKCHFSVHRNRDYYYERVCYKKIETIADVKDRYVHATSKKTEYEQIIEGLRDDFNKTQVEVFQAIKNTKDAVSELRRIALRPCVMHEDAYFDLIIKQESAEQKGDWRERVKMLEELKRKSKYISEVCADKFDPFQERLDKIKKQIHEEEALIKGLGTTGIPSLSYQRPYPARKKARSSEKDDGMIMSMGKSAFRYAFGTK